MNPFDILSKSLPRSVDTSLVRDTSLTSEVTDTNGNFSVVESFNALFEGMSDQFRREKESSQDLDERDALSITIDTGSLDVERSEADNLVFAILEGFLPRTLSQISPVTSGNDAQSSDASSQLPLQENLQVQETSSLVNSSMQSRATVTVQHQETHFKPIVEGAVAEIDLDDRGQMEIAQEFRPLTKPMARASKATPLAHQSLVMDSLSQAAARAVPEEHAEERASTKDQPVEMTVEHLDVRKNLLADGPQIEESGLSPATLQRLASSLRSEVHSIIDETGHHTLALDRQAHTFSLRTSDSVLRILNLQLHPADLGVVTVKMRLSGDSLEMELHTEKEETAQLLRHDSEKLSALLRGSGYRPDTITIQVNDVSSQDRIPAQRQSDMQFHGQSFQHSGTGQENHSQNQERKYAKTNAESLPDQPEDRAMGNRQPSGVYL